MKINLFFRRIFIKIIEFYQKYISPILSNRGIHCKYYPSCSEYMKQAIKVHGVIKGLWLGVIRILKCNPWGTFGYDPVPKKEKKNEK